ncbi:MAG: radical SAM protein [Clostridia bacterium]|nr:radical SAM protein [Clostridia bacterium]
MNLTLHLTADCNLRCRYCYETHRRVRMSEETAKQAVDLAFAAGHPKNGFSLFGGEPLLERGLIESVCRYASDRAAREGKAVRFKMTTNGALLDEDFLRFATAHGIEIALSHDGLLQDVQRLTRDGSPTRETLEPVVDLLLAYQPNAVAMQTVMAENVGRMADSVEWLYRRGFSRVNTAIDYRPDAGWDDGSMAVLRAQYEQVAALCERQFDTERPLRYLNFWSKIAAYLNNRPCLECKLGVRQPSVAPDGTIYPCNQFLNLPDYRMGDVTSGIDKARQWAIVQKSLAPEPDCLGCAIADRCRHHCACLNFSLTGDMHTVAPVQCEHERILIPIADALAGRLYARGSVRFLQQYTGDELAQ